MYETVTTFSLAGWDQYGKRFLDSYWEYPIHVYWAGEDHPQGYTKQVIWHNLSQDKQRDAFLEKYADKHSKDYRFNATKFCHKVLPLRTRSGKAGRQPNTGCGLMQILKQQKKSQMNLWKVLPLPVSRGLILAGKTGTIRNWDSFPSTSRHGRISGK